VSALLANGETAEGALLIGSDGLKSKVREVLNPVREEPVWSGYTCFAAISYCVPDDIKEVGYKVFLGRRKYFVSVDVGGGRIQWYAFLNIPPGGVPEEARTGERALEFVRGHYDGWSEEVFQLINNTPFDEVEQRDLYDRAPQLKWAEGRVCLLGDSAHPMMPNLGQGGCMAIEDAYVLGRELALVGYQGEGGIDDKHMIPLALKRYNKNRVLRAAAVQGMSRLSSAILFQYNHPFEVEWGMPPKFKNTAPKSIITRAGQGFLQNVAFPLQFEFLFDFPGGLGGGVAGDVEEMSPLGRVLMNIELAASSIGGRKNLEAQGD
jgi:zeaxanthin epoxidase